VTIGLLLIIFLELVFFDEYNTLYLRIIILTSISLSIGLLSILTIRFVQWTHHRPDPPLVISYTVAVAMMAATSLFLGLFMLVEMADVPDTINSSRMSITNSHVSNFEIQNFQATLGLISYIAFWFASVLLLRNTNNWFLSLSYDSTSILLGNISMDIFIHSFQFRYS
jgi:beta-lactamase regulating signal transducer with metallopeptidase domain